MCGVAGILNFDGSDELRARFFSEAECLLKNRGPNHFGSMEKDRLLLAHARLSVIDLSDGANQPMISKSGRSAIVFNGEIFNYQDLQKEIPFRLRTNSDTEVILELYELLGLEATLKKLHGQFAIFITDFEKNKSFMARDRFGQAPLYYCQKPQFTFSSDIRVITNLYRNNLNLDIESLSYYLTELSVPQPHSIWKEVKQVAPAHFMEIDSTGKISANVCYWTIPHGVVEMPESEALERIDAALTMAILRRTVSDVPVGCFLSGGVDSGLIVSMLASQWKEPIKTFSVGFDFEDFNELADASIIAKRYNTDHHEFLLSTNILNDLEKILACYGEPFADCSAIPTYYISREIKKEVTVALSGDGGDEMFGGYSNYGDSFDAEKFATRYPSAGLQSLAGWTSKIGSRINAKIKNRGSEMDYLKKSPGLRLYRGMGFHEGDQIISPVTSSFTKKHLQEIWESELDASPTSTLMRASLQTRLLNDYLVKVDRAAMDNSLEVRCPFLDHELAELAFSLPHQLMFKNGDLKYLLKKLGEKYMYADIFNRKKRGFGIPVKHWLTNKLKDFAMGHISDLVNRRVIVSEAANNLLSAHCSGRQDHTDRIWALICLELWFKKNI